jgi:DNA-binding NarL/FixJ family response regulator
LALRHARLASRLGWGGVRYLVDDEEERVSLVAHLAHKPVPEGLAIEVGGSIRSAQVIEVLSRLVSGQRVPSIAEQLHISPNTVRNHLKSMYSKLVVGTQADLIERVRGLSQASFA